jgi:hypothetical protein
MEHKATLIRGNVVTSVEDGWKWAIYSMGLVSKDSEQTPSKAREAAVAELERIRSGMEGSNV